MKYKSKDSDLVTFQVISQKYNQMEKILSTELKPSATLGNVHFTETAAVTTAV